MNKQKAAGLLLVMLLISGCLGGGGGPFPLQNTLTVDKIGQGNVDPVPGQHQFDPDTIVDLEAVPADGWLFFRWLGDVAETYSPTTNVVLESDMGVTAVFQELQDQRTLNMEVVGAGETVPAPGEHVYNAGMVIEVSATPAAGWFFQGWEGDVDSPNTVVSTVTLDDDKTVTAIFAESEGNGPGEPGAQVGHAAGGSEFFLRRAPGARFPIGQNDLGWSIVEDAFLVGETPVTYELWHTVLDWALSSGYTFANLGQEGSGGGAGDPPAADQQHPVTNVSFYDSIVWCNALSEMLGFDPVYTYGDEPLRDAADETGTANWIREATNGFRLLSRSEWELAARYKGSDGSHGAVEMDGLYWTPGLYASGAEADYTNAAATQAVAWYNANSGNSTQDVAQKQANGLGVFDMSGNVWEWTAELSAAERYVFRGGSYANAASEIRIADSRTQSGDTNSHMIGFRIARTDL